MEYLPALLGVVSGAVGGNVIGAVAPRLSMGTLVNSILGVVGGGIIGGPVMSMLGLGGGEVAGATDIAGMLSAVGGGAIGGGGLMAIVGVVRSMLSK